MTIVKRTIDGSTKRYVEYFDTKDKVDELVEKYITFSGPFCGTKKDYANDAVLLSKALQSLQGELNEAVDIMHTVIEAYHSQECYEARGKAKAFLKKMEKK